MDFWMCGEGVALRLGSTVRQWYWWQMSPVARNILYPLYKMREV
jgi:hypothetical protein